MSKLSSRWELPSLGASKLDNGEEIYVICSLYIWPLTFLHGKCL